MDIQNVRITYCPDNMHAVMLMFRDVFIAGSYASVGTVEHGHVRGELRRIHDGENRFSNHIIWVS